VIESPGMTATTFSGANRMPVRKGAVADPDVPVWTPDTDWADPAQPVTSDDFELRFWGVIPMRGGGLGPLKQLKLDIIFMDENDDEVAGVTFDYYTFDVITRDELGVKKGTSGRPFVRKTGAGTGFKCEESMIVDVNGTQAMGIRLFNITDGGGTAVKYIISATPVEYS